MKKNYIFQSAYTTLKNNKKVVIACFLTAGLTTLTMGTFLQYHFDNVKNDLIVEHKAQIEKMSLISYNEGWTDCEDVDSLQFDKYKSQIKKLKSNLKTAQNKPAQVVYKTKTIAAKADHSHCIPESDIITMDKDKYDYYRVSIGDVDYDKYTKMSKRIDYTYADQEKDIAKNKIK